ncbi:MAG: S16 family serine protease, partial [Ignavibacteria bacterium]
MEDQIGRTYGLFVSDTDKEGICFLLNVNYSSGNPSTNFSGSAEYIGDKFLNSFNYISRLINENLDKSYFISDVKKNFEVKLLDALNDPVSDFEIYGHSIELPLAIAILSVLLQKKIDSSIACSGNINEDLKVTYVDGLEEKIQAALIEYPEINKFVFPEDCRKFMFEKKFKSIEIIYIKNLKEGVEIFFPNFKEIINSEKFHGKIGLIDKEVEIVHNDTTLKAVELTLDFVYNKGFELIPEVILHFDRFFQDVIQTYKNKGIEIFLLNNFRPNWFIPALMRFFINKSHAVGVYYDREKAYLTVYTTKPDIIKLGTL